MNCLRCHGYLVQEDDTEWTYARCVSCGHRFDYLMLTQQFDHSSLMPQTLRDAVKALLSATYSLDHHGFIHYLDQHLIEDLREAYISTEEEEEPEDPF